MPFPINSQFCQGARTLSFPGDSNKFLNGAGDFTTPPGASEAWPIGSVFIAVVPTDPATLIGYGTWAAFGTGRVLVGLDAGDPDFDTVEETGGAKTVVLASAEMPSHTHVQNAHTHTQDSHNHVQDAHAHTQNSHNHTQDAHAHTQDAHNHTQNAHTHTQNSHAHAQQRNNVATGANTGWTTAFDTSSSSPQADSNTGTVAATAVNQNATPTNQATTATNQNATPTNQPATATNQNTTPTNQAAIATNQNATPTNQATGGGGAHNNLQPYIVVYMWKRTA